MRQAKIILISIPVSFKCANKFAFHMKILLFHRNFSSCTNNLIVTRCAGTEQTLQVSTRFRWKFLKFSYTKTSSRWLRSILEMKIQISPRSFYDNSSSQLTDIRSDSSVDWRDIWSAKSSITDDADRILTRRNPIQTTTTIASAGRSTFALSCADFCAVDVLILFRACWEADNLHLRSFQDIRTRSAILKCTPTNNRQRFSVKESVVLHKSVWHASWSDTTTRDELGSLPSTMKVWMTHLNLM